jgi:hypothetical protein
MPESFNAGILILKDGTPCIICDADVSGVERVMVNPIKQVVLVRSGSGPDKDTVLPFPLARELLGVLRQFENVGIGIGRVTPEKKAEDLRLVPLSVAVTVGDVWRLWGREAGRAAQRFLALRLLLWFAAAAAAVWHLSTKATFVWSYTAGAGGAFAAYGLYTLLKEYRKPRSSPLPPFVLITTFFAIILPFSVVAGAISHAVLVASADLIVAALAFAPPLRIAYVSMAAAALFLLRLRVRAVYGLSEVYVGLYIAAEKLGEHDVISLLAKDRQLGLTILCGGVYLIVRGLDNIHQGLSKDPVLALLPLEFVLRGRRKAK